MEVKIGVANASRELTLETSQTAAELEEAVTAALQTEHGTLTLTDDKGHSILVPIDRLAYVEVSDDSGRRVGFGTL